MNKVTIEPGSDYADIWRRYLVARTTCRHVPRRHRAISLAIRAVLPDRTGSQQYRSAIHEEPDLADVCMDLTLGRRTHFSSRTKRG
jgi:hypothetical protein